MRLSDEHRDIIKRLAAEWVGEDAQVLLFGSRVDDAARGGDVDLLVRAFHPLHSRLQTELQLGARLERALGGRRVDVLVIDPDTALQAVHRAAQATGVPL